jgi:hypothetical protein
MWYRYSSLSACALGPYNTLTGLKVKVTVNEILEELYKSKKRKQRERERERKRRNT